MTLHESLMVTLEQEEYSPAISDQALLEEIQDIANEGPGDTHIIEGVLEEKSEGDSLAMVFDTVADQALASVDEESPVLSVEALAFSLDMVFKSWGLDKPRLGLENFTSKGDRYLRIADEAQGYARDVRVQQQVSLESHYDYLRSTVVQRNQTVNRSKIVISQAMAKINQRAKELENSPVVINHVGIYTFLHYAGYPVTSLAGVMGRELKTLEALEQVATRFTDFYHRLASLTRTINGNGSAQLQAFVSLLISFDPEREMRSLNGISTLANGTIYITHTSPDDGISDVYNVLTVNYRGVRGDGSKASGRDKRNGALTGGIFGGVFGGLVGGAVGGAGGALIVGGVGAAAGILAGLSGAHGAAQGANTNSTSTVTEIQQFLKDSMAAASMTKGFESMMMDVYRDAERVHDYFQSFLDLMDRNKDFSLVLVDILGALLDVDVKTGVDRERYTRLVRQRMDALFAAHMSITEVATLHAWVCAHGAMLVTEAIIKAPRQG